MSRAIPIRDTLALIDPDGPERTGRYRLPGGPAARLSVAIPGYAPKNVPKMTGTVEVITQ